MIDNLIIWNITLKLILDESFYRIINDLIKEIFEIFIKERYIQYIFVM